MGVGRMLVARDVPAMMAIDFTGCLDEQGHLIPDHPAAKWLHQFDSYVEVSPSGTGVTLWVYATHDLGGRSERAQQLGDGRAIAVYRERQFLPLTGQRLIKYSGIVEWCQPDANGLYQAIFGGAEDNRSKPAPQLWQRRSVVKDPPPPARHAAAISAHARTPTPPTMKIELAKEFLQTTLAQGPVAQGRLVAAAKDRGISLRTLRRAKRALRVRSTRRTYQGHVVWDYRR